MVELSESYESHIKLSIESIACTLLHSTFDYYPFFPWKPALAKAPRPILVLLIFAGELYAQVCPVFTRIGYT